MDNKTEQVALWQLVGDWLEQTKLSWKISQFAGSNVIEKLDGSDWRYIGDDYIFVYPNCSFGNKLIAADPEFFTKLEKFINHIDNCDECFSTTEMYRGMADNLSKSFAKMNDDLLTAKHSIMEFRNTYVLPPIRYHTINISIDP